MQLLCALSRSKRRRPFRLSGMLFLCFTLLFLLLFALTRDVAAANVTLAWDPNPEPNLAGYKIHYGSQSHSYTSSIDVGKQTSYTITGLADGQTYYFAATAYDTEGNQSDYSTEVTWASAPPLDTDGDGISDDEETSYRTDPNKIDTDGDGISDGDELAFWGGDYNADFDDDGVINIRDYDSDGDGYSDGLEKDYDSDAADDGSTPTLTLEAHPSIELFDSNYAHETWLLIKWAEYNAASGETRIAKGDIDGDGKDEIVVGLGPVHTDPSIPDGLFEVLDDDYTHLAWGKIDWTDYNDVYGESWPACGDIDGDGDDEIIIGLGPGGAGKVEIFDYLSQNVTHMDWFGVDWADYNDACGETRPGSGDIDGDGKDEIVVGLGPVHTDPSIPDGLFEVLDDDYTHLAWGKIDWTDYNDVYGESWPACGDIDGDGDDEIIIGLGPGGAGKVEIFDYLSQNVTHMDWFGVDWADYNDACGETRPGSGDIDGDGKDEIVVGLGPVHTDPSIPDGLFEVLDDDYTHLAWGKIDWTDYNYVNGESRSACVDDDGDAICNIIIGLGSWISYTVQNGETTNAVELEVSGLRDTSSASGVSGSVRGDGDVCFIATAAFGSAVESHVKVLRSFRDTFLTPYALGRIFVRTYYKYSPPLAQFIAKHEILKIAVRIGLLPLIGFSYSMLHFGLVITLTILVVLLGTPVFLVSFYRWRSQGYKLNS